MDERVPSAAGAPAAQKRDSTISSASSSTSTAPLQAPAETSEHLQMRLGQQVPPATCCSNQHKRRDPKKWWHRTRIHIALLGLTIAAVNCYAQATFCIAIVEMVLPADYVAVGPAASSPRPPVAANSSSLREALLGASSTTDPQDQSCPIEFRYRDYYDAWRFPVSSNASNGESSSQQLAGQAASSQNIDVSNRFDWDASQQGLLLGAFAIGTAPLQILGGRLAEIYGSKWVLLMGCIGTGLTNLTIPYLAHFSFLLLLVNRVLMGVAQAGMEPGLMCLLADWLTPQEAGFFISMLLFAICLGFFLGSLCSSFILALDFGWPLTYYVSGGLNLLVGLVWFWYADSWPRVCEHISPDELAFIEEAQARSRAANPNPNPKPKPNSDLNPNHDSNPNQLGARSDLTSEKRPHAANGHISTGVSGDPAAILQRKREDSPELIGAKLEGAIVTDPLSAPWLNILSSPPVWAFIICKISIRWCADVLSNELPTYLANVLHLSIKVNGLLNSVSTALFAISSFVTGWLATSELCLGGGGGGKLSLGSGGDSEEHEAAIQLSNRRKTRLRKSFQSVASFGAALCLVLMSHFDCDLLVSMSMLLVLSCCLVMGTGGELQIPYDMSSRYPGTLHGLACSLSVSGWLAPPLIGLILGDQPSSRARWSLVWYSTAAINFLGGLMFLLFADASPRDFDRPRRVKLGIDDGEEPGPRGLNRQGGTAEHHDEKLAYENAALHDSSCESSPRVPHQRAPAETPKPLGPLEVTFDCGKLVRCRQSESSFIRPGALQVNCSASSYLADLAAHQSDLIYPYREAAAAGSAAPKLAAWLRALLPNGPRAAVDQRRAVGRSSISANEKFMRPPAAADEPKTTNSSETVNHRHEQHLS